MDVSSSFPFCYYLVNGISLGMAQSAPIKRVLPNKGIVMKH